MIVGVPKETKVHESRVAITPEGVSEFVHAGHTVFIENNAGMGSSISNQEFVAAGASIVATADEVWQKADLVLKVKEPIEPEYSKMRRGQTLFTYLHLAASKACTDALVKSGTTAIAYETVEVNGTLPLLAPMSEVAGRINRLQYIDTIYGGRIKTLVASKHAIEREVKLADLVIGAVLVHGAKAPKLVSNALVAQMKHGSVLVDIAIDQGGCFEDSKPTTHAEPTYTVHNSVFYCVANMPGAVPVASTYALTNATLPFALSLANHGWEAACAKDKDLAKGLNVHDGKIYYAAVAEAHGYPSAQL